jgi:hypothetical protein
MNKCLALIRLMPLVVLPSMSQAQEPCEPTVVIKSGFIEPASGYYACTVKQFKNNVVTTWTWSDDAAMLSGHRHKAKYAFACNERMLKLLEREFSGREDEDWVKPQLGTVADKWMKAVCSAKRFLN